MHTLRTHSQTEGRLLHTLDGQPAFEQYLTATGMAAQDFSLQSAGMHPFGVMADDRPLVRALSEKKEGALLLGGEVSNGTTLHLLHPIDLLESTEGELRTAVSAVGTEPRGALLFNCALRLMETEARGTGPAYHELLSKIPHIGFHTYGETWVSHLNHTLTGVIFF